MNAAALAWWVPLLLLLLVAQSTVLPSVAPAGLVPDPVLALVVCTGLRWGYVRGGALGLAAGLLVDFLGSGWLGANGLTRLLAGFFSGLVSQKEAQDPLFLPAAATFLATLVHEPVLLFLMWIWEGTGPPDWVTFWATLVPLGIMNGAFAVLLVRPFWWWELRQERQYRSLFRPER